MSSQWLHRSNIARAMILLMDDMQVLPSAQYEYASKFCLSDTEKYACVNALLH